MLEQSSSTENHIASPTKGLQRFSGGFSTPPDKGRVLRYPLRITLQKAPSRPPGPKSNAARAGLALDNFPPALARSRAWRWDGDVRMA